MSRDTVFADFRMMSYGRSFLARVCAARFLLLMASLVLGLNYSVDALATCARVLSSTGSFTGKCVHPESTSTTCLCSTATTSIKLGATHTGVEIACGDPSAEVVLGQENLHEYFLGVSEPHGTTPRRITVDVDMGTTKCTGTDLNTQPPTNLGQGNFKYRVQYEIDIATDADLNKRTADNACVNFNPDAPTSLKGKTSCRVNQTCTQVTTSQARMNVYAFCQAGVAVKGELTWIDPDPDSVNQPPQFTGCAADATNCSLRLGGLPVDDQNRVLPDVCNLIFAATTNLAQKQMLSVEQDFAGQCTSPTSVSYDNPVGVGRAVSRECHSDAFDNVQHGCPVLTDGKQVFVHTASAVENAKVVPVSIALNLDTLNLGCLSTGKDSGVIKATICGAANFDVSTVAVSTNGKFDPNVAPVLQTVKPLSFLIEQATGCGNDPFPDLTLTYPTCTVDGGVARVVHQQNEGITDKTVVPLELQGTLKPQAGELPTIIGGQDTVQVVNAP
jgi:hypothetical protein